MASDHFTAFIPK